MQREQLIGGVALLLVVAGIVGVAAVPTGTTTATPAETDGEVTLRESPITPGNVSGESAALTVTNWLEHRAAPVENVSLLVRAVDTETGLINARTRTNVGTVSGGGDQPVRANVTVDRTGSYRIRTLVFADGERVESGTSRVSGLEALTPDYADSGLQFHQFGSGLPTVAYNIQRTDGTDVEVNATAYLTNGGDGRAGDLAVVLRARQADSNIVADRAVVPVEDVGPGRTATPTARLSMPDNYTYQLDAILTRDDIIVDTETALADLAPTERVENDTQTESVDIQADSFAQESADDSQETPASGADRGDATTESGQGPGFGVGAAVLALLAGGLLVARRHNDREY